LQGLCKGRYIALGIDRWSEAKWEFLKQQTQQTREKPQKVKVLPAKTLMPKRPRIVKSNWLS